MPDHAYQTRACWLDLPGSAAAKLAQRGLRIDEGLHAAAHALLAVLPLRLSCDAGDVGCECDALRTRSLWPKRLMLFDKCAGGLGICDRATGSMLELLADALKLMRDCPCVDGCYCCVHTPKCPEYNAATNKQAAIAVAELILSAEFQSEAATAAAAAVAAAAAAAAAARRAAAENICVTCDDAVDLERERLEGKVEPPSMLGASIRRLRNLAPGVGSGSGHGS